jgi:hypothetical protein
MGLHFDLPNTHMNDPELKEHLKRVWWTSYVLDHLCASISSQLVSISDKDIFVDLSLNPNVAGQRQCDFGHSDWIIARAHLARLTRRTIKSVYGRRQQTGSFLQRVQYSLRDLKQWLNELPKDIQMDAESSHLKPQPIQSLHLTFNQVNQSRLQDFNKSNQSSLLSLLPGPFYFTNCKCTNSQMEIRQSAQIQLFQAMFKL